MYDDAITCKDKMSRKEFLVKGGAAFAVVASGGAVIVEPSAEYAATIASTPAVFSPGVNTGAAVRGATNFTVHGPELSRAGFGMVREDLPWGEVERARGVLAVPLKHDQLVNSAKASGLEPVLILGGSFNRGNGLYDGGGRPTSTIAVNAFANYAAHVASHFKGRVRHYEVWNEWDIDAPALGTAPSEVVAIDYYLNLLKAAYPKIKAADPNSVVLAPCYTTHKVLARGYLEKATQRGLLDYSDAVSFHVYNHWVEDSSPEWVGRFVANQEAMLKRYSGGGTVPLYITENGRSSSGSTPSYTEYEQAKYLARVFLLQREKPYVAAHFWFERRDSHGGTYGLKRVDERQKPSWVALWVQMNNLAGYLPAGRETTVTGTDGTTDHLLRFRNPSTGWVVLAIWTTGTERTVSIKASGLVEQTLMLGGKTTLYRDASGYVKTTLLQVPKYLLMR